MSYTFETPARSLPGRVAGLAQIFNENGILTSDAHLGRLILAWETIDPISEEWLSKPDEHYAMGILRMYRDVGWSPPRYRKLVRPNVLKPFGPGNATWVSSSCAGLTSHDPRYRRAHLSWAKIINESGTAKWVGQYAVSYEDLEPGGPPWHTFDSFIDPEKGPGLPPPLEPFTRVRLEKKDPVLPWSKDNAHWVVTEKADKGPRRTRAYQAWTRLGTYWAGVTGVNANPWPTFADFFRDVGLPPEPHGVGKGHWSLGKRNAALPHSAENTIWVPRGKTLLVRRDSSGWQLPIVVDPTIPPNTVELRAPSKPTVRVENIGAEASRPVPCPCGRRPVYDPDLEVCTLCVISQARVGMAEVEKVKPTIKALLALIMGKTPEIPADEVNRRLDELGITVRDELGITVRDELGITVEKITRTAGPDATAEPTQGPSGGGGPSLDSSIDCGREHEGTDETELGSSWEREETY